VSIEGQEVKITSPVEAVKAGLALVPEDRKRDGIVPIMEVKQNISLASLAYHVEKNGVLNNNAEAQLADKYIQELGIKTSSSGQLIKNLSGRQSAESNFGEMARYAPQNPASRRTHARY
jgi:ribose transport system ATP-binding protein